MFSSAKAIVLSTSRRLEDVMAEPSATTRETASSGEDEPIPLPAHRLDAERVPRVPLDLRPEFRDVHLAHPSTADVRAVPQRFHDRRTAHRPPGLIRQENEQS